MKDLINELKKDKVMLNAFLAGFFILFFTLVLILINYNHLPFFIPIFNQLPWGNERLMPTYGIFVPLVLYFAVYIFNIFFSVFIYKRNNPLLSRVIAAVTLMLSVMNLLFIIKTILLVL